MWRWLRVVMEAVRFFLATSSCLMSRVISFTIDSDRSVFALISRMRVNSSCTFPIPGPSSNEVQVQFKAGVLNFWHSLGNFIAL